ncbi:hypothetical protein SASPL_126364 [Salvia splendens]|uniref:Thioesterase domain-containing protein n=1 Tax=Salvia splendens TaxID=180675 RepID=A0A8X8XH31_SALSN|nr:hypothetical protein SASPL_126364 [Salvia splendens]
MNQPPDTGKNSLALPASETESLDAPLHMIGFKFDEFSAKKVSGRVLITPQCCLVAQEGDLVVAEATPVNVGKSIQVWEVRLSKRDPSNSEIQTLIASSRVTLLCNMSVPESARDAAKNLKKYAKL